MKGVLEGCWYVPSVNPAPPTIILYTLRRVAVGLCFYLPHSTIKAMLIIRGYKINSSYATIWIN